MVTEMLFLFLPFFSYSLADIQVWDMKNLKGCNQFIIKNKILNNFSYVLIAMKYLLEE